MINSSLIHIDELFTWVDDFTKATGLTTYAALQIYAECCYFQNPNYLLDRLLTIEDEYKRALNASDPDDEGDLDVDSEIWSEHYGKYQLTLDSISEEDARKFTEHYEKVLVHHGFKKQFSVYFTEHFHPLSEYMTANAPPVDKKFLFQSQYSYDPYFSEPPDAPVFRYHSALERLESQPGIDPAAWIAVFKMLGFASIDPESDPCWTDFEPSFYLGPTVSEAKAFCEDEGLEYDENAASYWGIFEQIPVYVTPFSITSVNTFHWDLFELRSELAGANDKTIVFYAAPYILRSPDNNSFISVWGEIFDGETWRIMTLNSNSTALETIIENSFDQSSEPDWNNISTTDQPLVDLWQKHHIPPEGLTPIANNSEVIGFRQ